jgi:hypothetical protein
MLGLALVRGAYSAATVLHSRQKGKEAGTMVHQSFRIHPRRTSGAASRPTWLHHATRRAQPVAFRGAGAPGHRQARTATGWRGARRDTWAEKCCSTPRAACTRCREAEPREAPGREGHEGIRGRDARLHHKKDQHQTGRCARRPPKHHVWEEQCSW